MLTVADIIIIIFMLKKNFTRKSLTIQIYKNLGFSKNFSLEIVDDFFKTISEQLVKFNKVKISSFGTFAVVEKKERMGRSPKTKIKAKISARKVIKFTPSVEFKNRINNL